MQFENRTRRRDARAQVRAGSLQELVYKQGQAGVTKASVSIVFNNSDPTRSPVGYESCEQITVTRQARPPRTGVGGEARDTDARFKRGARRSSSAAATSTSSTAKPRSRGAPPRSPPPGSCAAAAAARADDTHAHRSRVQNLFHSVQLNVNNPHFLIMQGRITKVLNMKPAEILSMLEEVRLSKVAQPTRRRA